MRPQKETTPVSVAITLAIVSGILGLACCWGAVAVVTALIERL